MDAKLIVAVIIVLVVGIAIGYNMTGLATQGPGFGEGNWTCLVMGNCTAWIQGQDWIRKNCELNASGHMNCNFFYQGQYYQNVPLDTLRDLLGIENLRECTEQECLLEVWAR